MTFKHKTNSITVLSIYRVYIFFNILFGAGYCILCIPVGNLLQTALIINLVSGVGIGMKGGNRKNIGASYITHPLDKTVFYFECIYYYS